MMEPPAHPGSRAVPMNMPGSVSPTEESIEPGTAMPPSVHKESTSVPLPRRKGPVQ